MNILYTRYSFVFALLLATTFSASAEPGHSKGGGVVRALNNNRQAEHKEVQIHRQEEKKLTKKLSVRVLLMIQAKQKKFKSPRW